MSATKKDQNGTIAKSRRAEPISPRVAKNGVTTYEFRIDVGIKPDGTRDRRRFSYPTKNEARREYRRISTEVAEGRYVAPVKITVGAYIKAWLDGRRDIRRVTVNGYRHALEPVVDRLGNLPLQQLTKAHLDDLVTWRLTEGRGGDTPVSGMATEVLAFVAGHPDGVRYAEVTAKLGDKAGRYLDRMRASGMVVRPKRGLYALAPGTPPPVEPKGVAARTVTTMLIQLSAALDDAVKQGLVTRNVARLVKRPDIADTEMQIWTREQSREFREHIREHRLYALFLLSLCGLRRSEVMGLRWPRIEGNTLHVRRGRVAIGKEVEGAPRSRGAAAGACHFRPTW